MNATTPLISVVTVVFNNVKSIRNTIESVVNQTYRAVEYIVIDGGSTDGTLDIIKAYSNNISVLISEKDTGIYNAMNKGIAMANGQWICLLNSGDVFVDQQTVQIFVDALAQYPDFDIVYGNILVKNKNGDLTEKIASEPCNKHRMFFCHQSAFVKTELLQKYPFDEQYRMSADLKFFKQCYIAHHKFLHLHFPVVVYNTEGISNTRRIDGLKENIRVIKEMDSGWKKNLFLLRLYFVIHWAKLRGKH
ncbi:glycosyl transferase [Bacteroidia bacterium]|nr:glycosyl transferase [Bacteroidia bacterium]